MSTPVPIGQRRALGSLAQVKIFINYILIWIGTIINLALWYLPKNKTSFYRVNINQIWYCALINIMLILEPAKNSPKPRFYKILTLNMFLFKS